MSDPAGVVLLATAALFELLTCYCRFRLGLRSRDHCHLYRRFTFGVRIHHGYIGAAVMACGLMADLPLTLDVMLVGGGGGLLLSDLVHHFVVLPIFTGRMD